MRCPACGSGTSSASSRCPRCDAPLGGGDPWTRPDDADAGNPLSGDTPTATTPFPPGPPPSDPDPPQARATWSPLPTPPSETTFVSPAPWDEPQVQEQPPRERRRRALPYVLLVAACAVLAAVAAVVLRSGGDDADTAAPPGGGSPYASDPAAPGAEPDATSSRNRNKAIAEAGAIDKLLEQMADTRADLGDAVTDGCPKSALQRILAQRQDQLRQADALAVDALDQGEELKDALVRALRASVESNQRYVDAAPGCPSESAVADVNDRASEAKAEFIRYWRPIAEREGMDPRSADTI
ncbi:hypothetical protein Arub01_35680 [Actinomadura rubrobrunea]|uniref:Uncharacterized protein n=1 Tax=Actinomadura rubrobrunea TaxID=115335 RepID=A0A9W6PVM9_9ACTN|nr:hypothetical protein Arub01_35680 [Actinomadura rubrobrunea]